MDGMGNASTAFLPTWGDLEAGRAILCALGDGVYPTCLELRETFEKALTIPLPPVEEGEWEEEESVRCETCLSETSSVGEEEEEGAIEIEGMERSVPSPEEESEKRQTLEKLQLEILELSVSLRDMEDVCYYETGGECILDVLEDPLPPPRVLPRRKGLFRRLWGCFPKISFRKSKKRSATPSTAPQGGSLRQLFSSIGLPSSEYLRASELTCQSTIGLSEDQVSHLLNGFNTSGHKAACFREMMKREQACHKDWAVFYHSYNSSALIYEVQAVLAEAFYGYDITNGPPPRLLQSHRYPDAPSLKHGIMGREFVTPHANDHNPKFREAGFCGTTTLFAGSGSEAVLMQCFDAGYSGGDAPDLTQALKDLLEGAGVSARDSLGVANDLNSVYSQASQGGLQGHLLQILVRRPIVDLFSYPCVAGGTPDGSRTTVSQAITTRTECAQVRMAANPSYFLHQDWFKVHHYAANSNLDRPALLADIRRVLKKAMGDKLGPLPRNAPPAASPPLNHPEGEARKETSLKFPGFISKKRPRSSSAP